MLYRLYRPKTFSDIEGQEHVIRTLQGALASERIGHAYFFAGPRGTGKTTMARVFAKALNCTARKKEEPCNACFSCQEINAGKSIDLIEIDAASNRGIDEIRALKESAGVAASSSRYKIFIVDEVHMLTPPAFNALLKTLEEPPAHIVFMLATTEPHKVPETILSRVQRLDFKKITGAQILKKLKSIADAEKLTVDDASLELIAAGAGGSLRDAESALSKVMAYTGKKITVADVSAILGILPLESHRELLHLIKEKQQAAAIAHIGALYESGVQMEQFAKQFIDFVRMVLLKEVGHPGTDPGLTPPVLVAILQRLMQARNELKHSPIPQLPLELALIDLTS